MKQLGGGKMGDGGGHTHMRAEPVVWQRVLTRPTQQDSHKNAKLSSA